MSTQLETVHEALVKKSLKKFALVPAPFDGLMTLDDVHAKANQQILDGKAKKMYVLEIIAVVEGATRTSEFSEEA